MAELVIKLVNGELAGKTVQSLRKEINAAAREANKAEIGTKAWIDAHARLDKAKGLQEDLRKQIASTNKASDALRSSWDRFVPFSGKFREIGESLGIVHKGVGGLTRSMGLLKAALISTGIGALVVLLGSLVTWLTSTQEGMDKLTSVTRPLGAVFQRLLGITQELGGKVFKELSEAISDPRQAFIDLGNAIKDNLLNRIEALGLFGPALAKIFSGEFASGFKDLGNAVLQASTGIENAIDKVGDATNKTKKILDDAWNSGKRIDELQKQIERAEIGRIVRSKQLELIAAQQKKIAEDETASFEERRAAAIAAMRAQEDLIDLEQAVLDKRIAKLERDHALNDTNREEEKELAELRAKRLEVEARLTEQSIELRNKLNTLNKQELEQQKAVQESIQDLRLEAMQEGFEKEIEEINLETERRIEALTGSSEQIAEQETILEEIRLQRIQEVRDRFASETAENDKQAKAEQLERDKKAAQDAIDLAKRTADQKRLIQEAYDKFTSDSLGIAIQLLSEDEEARKKNADAIKAFTVAKIFVDLQSEIAGYMSNPASTATFGIAGGLKAAIAIIRAGLAVREVTNQKFSIGGILKGPSHADGGIPIVGKRGKVYGEAEGGEIILTKGVSRNPRLRSAASRINEMAGGRKFEAGGPIDPFMADSTVSGRADKSVINMDGLTSKFDDMTKLLAQFIATQEGRVDRIKVINVVTETEEGIKTINKIKDRADV